MLTFIAEVIMSRFIASNHIENYPYFSNFIKGILIGLIGFAPNVFKGELIARNDVLLYFFIFQLIGLSVTVF